MYGERDISNMSKRSNDNKSQRGADYQYSPKGGRRSYLDKNASHFSLAHEPLSLRRDNSQVSGAHTQRIEIKQSLKMGSTTEQSKETKTKAND